MGLIEDLKSLEELHAKGRLRDEEFAAAKAATISGSKPPPAPAAAAPARAVERAVLPPPQKKPVGTGRIVWRLIGVGILLWLLWAFLGRPSMNTIKQQASLSADLKTDTFGLRAASWKSTPIYVPYNGSLTISVRVTRGNPVRVFLTDEAGVEKFKKTNQAGGG
jgi:hypothetical protein